MAQHFDVADYGAVSGLSDSATQVANRMAIQNAISAAIAAGGIVVIGKKYYISKYVYVYKAEHLSILGESGGMLVHPSDDIDLRMGRPHPQGGGHSPPPNHRSAIVIRDSSHVEVTGLGFQGGLTPNQDNVGAGVCISNSSWVRLENCYLDRGGKLFEQDSKPNDFGLTVLGCKIYGAFSASNPGRQSLVSAATSSSRSRPNMIASVTLARRTRSTSTAEAGLEAERTCVLSATISLTFALPGSRSPAPAPRESAS